MNVSLMLLVTIAINQNVIDIDSAKDVQVFSKSLVNEILKIF